MPLREFKCKKCGYLVELLMRSDSSAPDKCPKCGHNNMERQFSTFAVSEKASGRNEEACSTCPNATCPYAKG